MSGVINAKTHHNDMSETPAPEPKMVRENLRLSIFGFRNLGAVSTVCFASFGYRVIGIGSNCTEGLAMTNTKDDKMLFARDSLSKIFASGMNDYLQKPATRDELLNRLMRWTGELKRDQLLVLLADDDPTARMVTKAILEKAGHLIDVVGNGSMAVKAVKQQHFDAVLMDIDMPVLNGYQATHAIRLLLGIKSKIPILAMTAYAVPEQSWRYNGISLVVGI